MTDRERLILDITKSDKATNEKCKNCTDPNGSSTYCGKCACEQLADNLLADGWIRPPCKVGDKVYVPWIWDDEQGIASVEVQEFRVYDNKNHWMFFIDMESDDEDYNQLFGGWRIEKCIGKTVFLTKEEAEKELEKRCNNA